MIYKLEREATAQLVIKHLPRLWNSINHLVFQLRKTSRTYSTVEVITLRDSFINNYNLMKTFSTSHNAWFAARYPEFASALDDAITSLQNLNNVITAGLHNNYWDTVSNKPVICDISQLHRDALANSIESELE
jgi:hypothetical protein